MASIKMPATPRSAYDPKRPANALLLAHVRELEKAVSEAGRRVRRKKPKTEEQVAGYIRHLNRALHQQILLPPMKRRPLDVPLDGPSSSRVKSRPASRKRAAGSLSHRKATSSSRKKKASPSRKRKRSRRS